MPLTRDQKEKIVTDLSKLLRNKTSAVITDFTGTKAEQMAQLRRKLHEAGCDYSVVKKSLLDISLTEADQPEIDTESLEGQIAIATSPDDEVTPAKIIYEFAKDHNLEMILKGIVGEEEKRKEQMVQLAQLPSKDELQAQLVGSLKSPLVGLENILSANTRKLCMVLRAKAEQA